VTGAKTKPVSTTILVIDDDIDVLWSTAKIIRDSGFVVLEGASAEDAIKLTTQYHPALVLLDVDLPDGDGVDIALHIKKDPALSSVFIVLCSGKRISPGDQVEGLNRGHADGYITRPVGKDELVARIDAFLRIRAGMEALRESEEKYRSILKASPDDITITNLEGIISMVSPAALTIFGFKHEDDLVGHSITEFIAPDDRDRAAANIVLMDQGGFLGPGEYRAIRADGSTFDMEVNGEFIRDGNGHPMGMVFIARDITGRKLAEESLKESNQKLRLLTGLTRHDILNQLSAIQLLQDLALHSSDLTKMKEYLVKSQEVATHIEATIGFTRDYEGFGTVSSGWQKIGPIIESAKAEVSLGNVRVYITIPERLEVYADPIIRKVFTTLLDNAVRHGKNITNISLSYSEYENTLVIICEDDGGGVPVGEKEYIFDHGYGKNTGIGLFLAREILSITGLSIRECGVLGKGARFEITVPRGKFKRPDLKSA
jgi:PAS domain S-box-containing protein